MRGFRPPAANFWDYCVRLTTFPSYYHKLALSQNANTTSKLNFRCVGESRRAGEEGGIDASSHSFEPGSKNSRFVSRLNPIEHIEAEYSKLNP